MKFLIHSLLEFIKDPHYRSLMGASIIILFGGAAIYSYVEGWRYIDSLYFSAITLTTIGYGDFAPQTDAGKLFTVVYIGFGVGLILAFINTVYAHFQETRKTYGKKSLKKENHK